MIQASERKKCGENLLLQNETADESTSTCSGSAGSTVAQSAPTLHNHKQCLFTQPGNQQHDDNKNGG